MSFCLLPALASRLLKRQSLQPVWVGIRAIFRASRWVLASSKRTPAHLCSPTTRMSGFSSPNFHAWRQRCVVRCGAVDHLLGQASFGTDSYVDVLRHTFTKEELQVHPRPKGQIPVSVSNSFRPY